MARPFPIGDQSEGINLARYKGGASPRSLYDLVNGWVTPKKVIRSRGGAGNPIATAAGTVGGIEFEGKIHVFSATPVLNEDPLIAVHILRHPTGAVAPLLAVHQAFHFLGRIYCVAEWTDGTVRHFWLQEQPAWAPATVYQLAQVVSPRIANGFVYEVNNDPGLDVWTPNTEIALNDEIVPTVSNGFKYKATALAGAPTRTGESEPVWPTTDGATLVEYDSA